MKDELCNHKELVKMTIQVEDKPLEWYKCKKCKKMFTIKEIEINFE